MDNQTSHITAIGHIANLVVGRNPAARVLGRSSRGIYLQPEGDLTLFLSGEQYRGPLTINLALPDGLLPSIQPGDQVIFAGDALQFPDHPLHLSIRQPLIWMPPQPPSFSQQAAALFETTATQARSLAPDHPFSTLLEGLTSRAVFPASHTGLVNKLDPLYGSYQRGVPGEIRSAMEDALGAGPGLTPLADDLLLGILLAEKRVRNSAPWKDDLENSQRSFLAAARAKTSTLSWSLLTCAAQGSADERIIAVLDGLTAARPLPDQVLIDLLEWGSSSGIAVLAGLILVLQNQ
jgi:hypothetical protein